VEDVQLLIESSKFEPDNLQLDEIQKRTGDGQIVFVLLLSLARQSEDTISLPDEARAAAVDLDTAVATALEAMATQLTEGPQPAMPDLDGALDAFERSLGTGKSDGKVVARYLAGRLALYRPLVAGIKQVFLNGKNLMASHVTES
jgi:hypothetical protein